MVVVFMIVDWRVVMMNTTTMIPCVGISWRELAITLSFDWFSVLSVSFVIGRVTALVLILRHPSENRFNG